MALFKVSKGSSANLPSDKHDGYCYFTTDDGKFYIDYLDSDGTTLKRRPIAGVSVEYIVGTQTASTNAWTGKSADSILYTGKVIAYRLPTAGTSNAATLNLTLSNGTTTGPKNIKRQGTGNVTTHYPASTVIFMVYDGTQWQVNADYDSNSDYRVRQTNATGNNNHRILLSFAATNDQEDNITYKSGNFTYNPSTNLLTVGNLHLTANLTVGGDTEVEDLVVNGDSNFIGDVNFAEIPTAPTAATGEKNSKVATTEFVDNSFTNVDVLKDVSFSAGSTPTLGTAIAADDITSWSAGSLPTLGTAIPADDITSWSAGTLPTLGTAIAADDITAWSAGSATTSSVANGVLTITVGVAPSLSYTARSIPNVTGVGTLPTLAYTAKSIPNVTGVGTLPSLSYTARSIPNVTGVGTKPSLTKTTQTVVRKT